MNLNVTPIYEKKNLSFVVKDYWSKSLDNDIYLIQLQKKKKFYKWKANFKCKSLTFMQWGAVGGVDTPLKIEVIVHTFLATYGFKHFWWIAVYATECIIQNWGYLTLIFSKYEMNTFFLFLFSSIYVLAFTVGKERSFNFTIKNFKLQMINYIQLCNCVTLICLYVRQSDFLKTFMNTVSTDHFSVQFIFKSFLRHTHTHKQAWYDFYIYY